MRSGQYFEIFGYFFEDIKFFTKISRNLGFMQKAVGTQMTSLPVHIADKSKVQLKYNYL